MRRIKLMLAMVVAGTCVSCGGGNSDACRADEVFCASGTEWEKRASQMDTERVFRLHVVEHELYRPPPGAFLKILGLRGEETLRILNGYLRNNPSKRYVLFYQPIVFEVIVSGRVDFCRSSYYGELEQILSAQGQSTSYSPKRERANLAAFCASPYRVPIAQ